MHTSQNYTQFTLTCYALYILLIRTWLLLISLKFVISDRLPKISYLTILDYYLFTTYLIMIVLIMHVCSMSLVTTGLLKQGFFSTFFYDNEAYFSVRLFTSWILLHIILSILYVWRSNGYSLWNQTNKN